MIFFPAIDIKGGKVVRLTQGDYDKVTEYAEDPLAQAQGFVAAGASWIHVVDLDAAKAGAPVNAKLIQEMATLPGVQIQIGGGIRTVAMAETYLNSGVARVVVGTKAVQDPSFLAELGDAFPEKVALGLDTKGGRIAIHGWTQTVRLKVDEFIATAPMQGIACLIFTDIARDGMLTGPNLIALQEVMDHSPIPVIASGGVASLQDLKKLYALKHPKLLGVISGKAIYEGRFTLGEALALTQKYSPE